VSGCKSKEKKKKKKKKNDEEGETVCMLVLDLRWWIEVCVSNLEISMNKNVIELFLLFPVFISVYVMSPK